MKSILWQIIFNMWAGVARISQAALLPQDVASECFIYKHIQQVYTDFSTLPFICGACSTYVKLIVTNVN